MSRWILVGLYIACSALLTLSIAACDLDASLRDAVARAIAKTSEAQSFRSTNNGIILTDTYVKSDSSDFEYASPGYWHYLQTVIVNGGGNVTFTIYGEGGYPEVVVVTSSGWLEIIAIDGRGYSRDEDQPEWTEFTAPWMYRPLDAKLERYRFLVDLDRLIDENIRGVNCSHYRGKVDMDSYVEMLKKREEEQDGNISEERLEALEVMRRQEHVADFWIDDEDYIRQWKTEGQSPVLDNATGQEQWVTWVGFTRYSDFNEPITIESPK